MNNLPSGWEAICEDESIMYYDSISKAVWIRKGRTPIRMTTGSKRKLYLFGAVTLKKNQTFSSWSFDVLT